MTGKKKPNPAPKPTAASPEAGQAGFFAIVGIGASAGGLDAFTQLLKALPADTGMGFVLVQHLAPSHASSLAEILSRATPMPVTEVEDGQPVRPNHVYVIPPGARMLLARGLLRLVPRETAGQQRVIDQFFRSLAEDQGHRAIGVVLSGTATDGTLGLEEIKAEGGITFAQDDSAQHDSMPRSAVAAGCVDFVLPPKKIAEEIARIARHPYLNHAPAPRSAESGGEADRLGVLQILRNATGVDLTNYKATTFDRRVTRRMVLQKIHGLEHYTRFLRQNPGEVEALYQDILISVTSFFRNPETFAALVTKIFPKLLEGRLRDAPLRVWVPGCSTGDEAYSIAIAWAEFAAASGNQIQATVFATDLNPVGIAKGRAGVYSKNIAQDVAPERLRRFFVEVDGNYRVAKAIRDQCVFAQHNVISDPPFSHIDLISCRNLLIYLEPGLQQQVLQVFHYALNPGGVLLLGASETTGSARDLFDVLDAKHRFYAPKPGQSRLILGRPDARRRVSSETPAAGREREPVRWQDLEKEADRLLMAMYVPPGVLVNANLEILQFRGDTSPYLTPAPGKASFNLLKMARQDLLVQLRAAIPRASKDGIPVRVEGVRIKSTGGYREIGLEVIPLKEPAGPASGGFLVLFEDAQRDDGPSSPANSAKPAAKSPALSPESSEREVARLAQELVVTREYLQSVIERLEATNEELQSANEEAQSANEELQSINEELETSKEEIQSSSEELTTVNDELNNRNRELNRANAELERAREYAENIVATVTVPLLVLDGDLRVRTANQAFYKTFEVRPEKTEGRRLHELGDGQWNIPALRTLMDTLLSQNSTVEAFEVEHTFEHIGPRVMLLNARHLAQASPAEPLLLLAIEDITARKHGERDRNELLRQAEAARAEAEAANQTKDLFLATLSHELRTPLTVLLLEAQWLRREMADNPVIVDSTEVIERAVKAQAQLIGDMLDVSRIAAGKLEMQVESVDLGAIVQKACDMVQAMADKKSVALDLTLEEATGEVTGDAARLQQIVWNLAANAIKFTPTGGRVSIRLEFVEGHPRIRVSDTGIGIDPKFLPRIFNRFEQADSSTTRAHGGLGLGLTIVRSLVELHGGTVQAESAGEGKGATFTVTLPAVAPKQGGPAVRQSVPLRPASPTADEPRDFHGLRILVVEDDPDTRESLIAMLGQLHADVRGAASAPEAMLVFEAFRPQVLVCDIAMPGEDGYSLIRRVRKLGPARGGRVPALALTALASEEDRQRALAAGFQLHLAKPIDFDQLADVLLGLPPIPPPQD